MSELYTLPFDSDFRKTQIVVTGYLSQNNCKDFIIPEDVVDLCVMFYTEVGHWDICNKDLDTFLNSKNGYKFYSNTFYDHIHNISVRCGLICNKENDKNTDKFSFQVFMGDSKINKIIIFFHVYCYQTNRNVKYTAILTRFDNFENEWAFTNLPLFDCSQYNQLNMRIYFEPLDIIYQTEGYKGKAYIDYHKDVKLKRHVTYKWKVRDDLLKVLHNCPVGKGYFSANFDRENKNWSLLLLPKGKRNESDNLSLLMLAVNRIPTNIYRIEMKYVIKNNQNNKVITKTEKVSYLWWTNYSTKEEALFDSDILNSIDVKKGLIFFIDVEIVNIYKMNRNNWDGDLISKEEWYEYAIID